MSPFEQIPEVIAVATYGSVARGDADSYSDKDILIVLKAVSPAQTQALKLSFSKEHETTNEGISLYSTSSIRTMAAQGSLFLWHIKLEGRIERDVNHFLREALAGLKPYCRYAEDLSRYQEIIDDVASGYADREGRLNECDLHALFVVARNALMLLTVAAGRPAFGRRAVYAAAAKLFPLPLRPETYSILERWHLRYSRGFSTGEMIPHSKRSREILENVLTFLSFVKATVGNG